MSLIPRQSPEGGSLGLRGRIVAIYALLIAANVAGWVWAFVAFRHFPLLLGTALLAYSFGLRHAVDADHIAAIDNVTRKLMQTGQRPAGVGLFFSLGHSTIVVLATALVAATATAFAGRFTALQAVGGLIGTGISAAFLFAIALVNLLILRGVYSAFRRVHAGERYCEEDLNALLAGRGLIARLVRPLFGLISRSWHMYPLGVLFGLGFDTATEVGLLGISAAAAARGLSIWSILVFPVLFTAGMSLIDATDGILMLGAYGWAFARPVRKLYYNLVITLVSVVVAVLVGGVETLGLIGGQLKLGGPFWDAVDGINDHFGLLGFAIIGFFVASWGAAALVYRLKGYDALDSRAAVAAGE